MDTSLFAARARHHASTFATFTLVACLLAGCSDGGSGGTKQANAQAAIKRATTKVEVDLPVTGLTLVKETRVGRSVFDYEFKITLQNDGPGLSNVIAVATAAGPGTTIVEDTILLGTIGAGATVTPEDTITLRHDRTLPFVPGGLVWRVSADQDAAGPIVLDRSEAITGADSNANGIRDDVDQLVARIGPAEQRKALEQMARSIQRSLSSGTTEADAAAAALAMDEALGCLRQHSADYADQSTILFAATVNTETRFRANARFVKLLTGVDRTEMPVPVCIN